MSVDEKHAVNFVLTAGQASDTPVAEILLQAWNHPDTKAALMDKAYGSKVNREICQLKLWEFVVPPRSNAKNPWEYNKQLYKRRNEIERLFHRIKNFRRVATRYDKLAHMYSSFVALAFLLVALS